MRSLLLTERQRGEPTPWPTRRTTRTSKSRGRVWTVSRSRRRAGAKRGLEALEDVADGASSRRRRPRPAARRGPRPAAACSSRSSASALARSPRGAHGSSSAQRGRERDVELQRRLATAPGVDVGARAERAPRRPARRRARRAARRGAPAGAARRCAARGAARRAARAPPSGPRPPARPRRSRRGPRRACSRRTSRTSGSAVAARCMWSTRLRAATAACGLVLAGGAQPALAGARRRRTAGR